MRLPATKSTNSLTKVGSQTNLKAAAADTPATQPVTQQVDSVKDQPKEVEIKAAHEAVMKTAQSDVDLFQQSNAQSVLNASMTSTVNDKPAAKLPPPRPSRPSTQKPNVSTKKLPDAEPKPEDKIKTSDAAPLQSEVKPEVKPEIQPETKPEVIAESTQEAKSEIPTEVKPQVIVEVREPEIKAELKQEIKPEIKDEVATTEETSRTNLSPQLTKTVASQQSTQVSVGSAVTMADTANAPQRVDESTGEPSDVDPALNAPKFEQSEQPSTQLLAILKLEHHRMSASQKEAYRQYLVDFIACYQSKDKYAEVKDLHNNTKLLDQCFECIGDDKNFSIDKILNVLVILSRHSQKLNGGLEPRISKIFDLLKTSLTPADIVKEAVKSLINYSEANVKMLSSGSYVDVLMSHYSSRLSDTDFILNMLKVLRNLTVTDHCRKSVLDKLGYLIVNSINQHSKDKGVVENACWVLGNCAVSSESVTFYVSIGTFQALKVAMVNHADSEKNAEAALWLLFNVTYDQASVKIILKALLEENIIDAIKRFGSKNSNVFTWADLVLKRLRAAIQASSPQAVAERIASKTLHEDYVMVQTGIIEDYVFQKFNKLYMVVLPAALMFTVKDSDLEILMEVRFKDVVDISTYPPQVKEPIVADVKDSPTLATATPMTPNIPDAVLDQELPLSFSERQSGLPSDSPEVTRAVVTDKSTDPPTEKSSDKADNKPAKLELPHTQSMQSFSEMATPVPPVKVLPNLQVQTQPAKVHIKQIKITTRQRVLILQGKTADFNMDEVFVQLKGCWKHAVSAVTENAASNEPKLSPTSFTFSVPETILAKDLEKVCFAHVIHEIYSNPFYVTYKFKCQQQFPNVAIWDFVVVKLTKKFSLNFIDKHAEQYKSERGFYEAVALKAKLTQIVDDSLMAEVEAFEAKPDVSDAPNVSTMYEYCAKQGIRPTMEDRHIHLPYIDYLVSRDNKSNPSQYYAVYDGHGGTHVAAFVETSLHYNLMKHPALESDIKLALSESFMKTQEDLKQASDRLYLPTTAGSTAVVLYFTGKKIYCAWAGDSLASLYRKKEIIELVDPHKPGKDSEKARIEKLGGFVAMEGQILRVNGVVAVSRAFGNIRHRVIIPECDIKEVDLTGDEEYIVLACDGLWDVMTPPQVKQFVTKYMKKHSNKTAGLSEALVDESLRLGSTDNVSVVFIEFRDWKLPKR